MKKMICLTLSLMFVTLFAGAAFAATLSVRADNWPPYNADPADKKPGYMIEVLKEIFEPQGITIDYKLMPWTRALHDVNGGKFDAAVGTDRAESPEMVFPSEPFGLMLNNIYVRSDSKWRCNGVESLQAVRLGAIDGYTYGPQVTEYVEKHRNDGKVFIASGDDALPQLIKMLQAGRIDAVVENLNVMAFTLGELNVSNVISAGNIDKEPQTLEVGFSPKRPTSKDYARMFDEGIVKLRASGRLAQILKSYGVLDWK